MSEDWLPFVKRLEAFAERYCRKKPSLGMIGEMAWVLGVDLDFRIVPREDTDSALQHPSEGVKG